MAQFKLKVCKETGKEWKQYSSFQKCPCCIHSKPQPKETKKYVIPKVSDKRKIENLKYSVLRIEFLGKKENQICPITKQQTIEVHHTYCGKDRAKYYLDVSTWLAVSRDGHNWIHDNPKEARELGFLK